MIELGDLAAEAAYLRRYRQAVASGRHSAAALAKMAASVRAIDQRRRDHPLAYARLWDRDAPRTSQRRAVREVLEAGRISFVLGGNRSGKSEAGAQLDAAMALGGDDPAVVAWCRWNGLPVERIPTGPGRVWSVALTGGDSRRYVRPKVARYLPAGTAWRNRDGQGEAEATAPNGGRIVFKSVRQGRAGFQGDSIRWLHFDEEPNDPAVFSEALMRLVDQAGRCCLTMTPLSGWTPLLAGELRDRAVGTVVARLFGSDNPHVPRLELEQLLARYGEHERAARERGEITALEGRIWPAFSRALHVVPAESVTLSPDWPRYAGVDFGSRVPTAVLWGAYDESADILYVQRGYYQAERTTPEIARALREAERALGLRADDEVVDRWADPEARQTRADLSELGIGTSRARKDVLAGISAVAARLQPSRADGRPGLVILDGPDLGTRALLDEIESYVWEKGGERPRKIADHACDALRYLCMGIQRKYGIGGAEVADDAA